MAQIGRSVLWNAYVLFFIGFMIVFVATELWSAVGG